MMNLCFPGVSIKWARLIPVGLYIVMVVAAIIFIARPWTKDFHLPHNLPIFAAVTTSPALLREVTAA